MRSLFAGLAALAIAAFGAAEAKADKLQDILSKGVVRIGVPLDAPPFGAQDKDRKPIGFDIEMAEMVAKGLGVKLEMQQITGANRIPFLMTDKVDIVISVMGLTPERALEEALDIEPQELRSRMQSLKKEMDALGPVNPNAVEEYENLQ